MSADEKDTPPAVDLRGRVLSTGAGTVLFYDHDLRVRSGMLTVGEDMVVRVTNLLPVAPLRSPMAAAADEKEGGPGA